MLHACSCVPALPEDGIDEHFLVRCGQEPVAVKSRWSNRQDEDLLLCRARRARCHGPAHITLCTCSSSPSNPDGATVLSGKYHSATENAGSGTCKLGNVNSGASRELPTVSTSRRARASRLWPRRLVPGTDKRFIWIDSTCQCYNTDPRHAALLDGRVSRSLRAGRQWVLPL